MHNYSELIGRCTAFTLGTLNEANERTIEALQTSGATSLVKTLQVIQIQKAIFAMGIFSLFEAILQDELKCYNGFANAKTLLKQANEIILLEKFSDLELAINVLKHGKGRSYDTLVAKNGGTLNQYVKELNESDFEEGNVSEIQTLINVNDNFIIQCTEIIEEVSIVIKSNKPLVNL
jgi:hypothetical protein